VGAGGSYNLHNYPYHDFRVAYPAELLSRQKVSLKAELDGEDSAPA